VRYFFDTSALLKRYINEKGHAETEKLFDHADKIIVSSFTQVECASSFKRLWHTEMITKNEYQKLNAELNLDFPFFESAPFDDEVKNIALKILEKHIMKALDTIQLATLIHTSSEVDAFVVCDQKLKKYGLHEGFLIIDPTETKK